MTPETGSKISFDTPRVVLVPEEEYGGGGAEYLRFGGMEPADGEVVVESKPVNGIVAVMAVPTAEWAQYEDRYERGEVDVTSPLLDVATEGGKRVVRIALTAENVYLAVWEKGLRMAEALPDNTTDSILYYMQVVGRRFNLRRFEICVSGQRADIIADALRQYHKKVKIA